MAVLWVLASTTGGALLALLAKRLHPALSFRRLWVFYAGLLGAFVALVFGVAYH